VIQLVPLTVARALRWRALLPPSPPARVAMLSWIVLASQALNNVLPLRPGEAYRTVALHRRGFAIDRVIAAQAGEKLVEAASLGVFAVPVLATPGLFHGTKRLAIVVAVALALVVLIAAFVRGVGRREGVFARVLARAIETLRSPSAWVKSFAFALAADVLDVVMIALSAGAVGLSLSLVGCATVLVFVNFASVIPAAPGQIGTLEAGAVGALVALGHDPSAALAVALLYHVVHVAPATIAGALVVVASRRAPRAPEELPS
jgi:uncharacterized membrane protein YbhN (UPF0104 family)